MITSAADKDSRRRPGLGLIIIATCSLTLAACSGSSRSYRGPNTTPDDSGTPTKPVPALSLSASPSAVSEGGFTKLSWKARKAQNCEASGGWKGSKRTSGSQKVGPLKKDTVFYLSCSGSAGGVSRQVTVSIGNDDGPDVSLRAEAAQVSPNGTSTLSWSTQDVTSCTASGGWAGSRGLTGSFSVGPLTETTSYTLSCSGDNGSALATVTVEVLDKVLRWRAPTQNVDGTPLTDLAGYVVYWGTQSRAYTGSHSINDPSITQWEATTAPGNYFFALTALDAEGHESGYSNEVRKTVP